MRAYNVFFPVRDKLSDLLVQVLETFARKTRGCNDWGQHMLGWPPLPVLFSEDIQNSLASVRVGPHRYLPRFFFEEHQVVKVLMPSKALPEVQPPKSWPVVLFHLHCAILLANELGLVDGGRLLDHPSHVVEAPPFS